MSLMADYSDNERDTVRSAAFGAMLLVSKADPGFFAMFKESMAGSKVLAKASPELREMLTGGMPSPPTGKPEEIDAKVLTSLEQAVAILTGLGRGSGLMTEPKDNSCRDADSAEECVGAAVIAH